MKIDEIVKLIRHSNSSTRGIIGNRYKIVELKKTELKLCSEETNDHCFYTHPDNVEPLVQCTIPDWVETRTSTLLEGSFEDKLDKASSNIIELLKSKNKAYGNTALNPVKIFSRLDATEALCARIDDKIMRIKNKGINDQTEDTVDDLIGYLLLLKMSMQ